MCESRRARIKIMERRRDTEDGGGKQEAVSSTNMHVVLRWLCTDLLAYALHSEHIRTPQYSARSHSASVDALSKCSMGSPDWILTSEIPASQSLVSVCLSFHGNRMRFMDFKLSVTAVSPIIWFWAVYMPEFDPDAPGKTWDTAGTTMINLYGSCDETDAFDGKNGWITLSNPLSIAGTVSILQELLDEDSSFTGLWSSATPDPIRVVHHPRTARVMQNSTLGWHPSVEFCESKAESTHPLYIFDPVPLTPSQTVHITLRASAMALSTTINWIRCLLRVYTIPAHVLQILHENSNQSMSLKQAPSVTPARSRLGPEKENKGKLIAPVQELKHINELLYPLDPEELSRSSSLVSHVQELPNSFNISDEVDDEHRVEDQVSKLKVTRTEGTAICDLKIVSDTLHLDLNVLLWPDLKSDQTHTGDCQISLTMLMQESRRPCQLYAPELHEGFLVFHSRISGIFQGFNTRLSGPWTPPVVIFAQEKALNVRRLCSAGIAAFKMVTFAVPESE
ncbi:hypothetical protein B0H19DRAFT_1072703 [Mycena capillaripes]|nr:hypothetical protein B0H19DRAFT_1072703 [Mycena capillaripes]